MKADFNELPITVDRVATSDEIRAAFPSFLDPIEQFSKDLLYEIAADLGGYVRIPAEQFEASLLVGEWMKEPDTLLN